MVDTSAKPSRGAPALVVLRRLPATLILVAAVLACGVLGQGLWSPFVNSPLFEAVAYGLPALEAGRWWTPVTGAFFVVQPWVYIPTLLGFWGLAVVEYLRGWRIALAYFWVGQLFGVFATALVLWVTTFVPEWTWAHLQATALDVGPSIGAYACMAAASALLAPPWRLRVQLVLVATVVVALLFIGAVADLEHLAALLLVLVVTRSLRIRRISLREQRLIAFVAMLSFAAIDVIFALVPTDGPFGSTDALEGWSWSTTVDIVVILLIANGLRRARRWAWVIALILMVLNILSGALLLGVFFLLSGSEYAGVGTAIGGEVSVGVAQSVLALLLLIYLIAVRRAFRWRRRGALGALPAPDASEIAAALQAHGGGTLSWMTTWEGNEYARTSTGFVAYQRRAGVALALADPVGPAEGRARSVAEFVSAAEHAGLVPCFFSCGEETRSAVPPSWRSLVVADDTIVDLPGIAFTGKRWVAVRAALNRAERESVTFRMARLRDEPWGVRAQLRAISDSWVGDKGLPEMGFTLGTLEQAEDPEVRVALAVAENGDVEGFLSWLPVYGDGVVRGWTLDLMRRRDGGFGPVMEFLIGSSAAYFRDEGAEILSLSGAPLAHEYPPEAGAIAALSDKLAELLEPVYGFASLHRFKEKFHPRYETMYLVFRDEADLARIGLGLTRAFLPDATLRQFAGAGVDLIRGGDR